MNNIHLKKKTLALQACGNLIILHIAENDQTVH